MYYCVVHQLRRLIDAAGRAANPVAIVVFGLVDFEQFFAARERAEQLRAAGSRLYPRLEDDYRYFNSMRPEHRQGMIALARMMNAALERMIADIVDEATFPSHVTLRYSNALRETDISSAATLSEIDGCIRPDWAMPCWPRAHMPLWKKCCRSIHRPSGSPAGIGITQLR